MLRRILATAIIAGFVAGVALSLVQSVWVAPLILHAETYEVAAAAATGEAAAAQQPWAPDDGVERTMYSALANVVAGVAFGLVLVGAISLSGREVDWRRGLLWGLGGFAAFALAPAIGLLPDPPGVDAGPLLGRQIWWLGTVAASAAGLAALVFARRPALKLGGVALLILPHAIGAPHVDIYGGATPADVIDEFIVASLVTTGLFWLTLGGFTGLLYRRFA